MKNIYPSQKTIDGKKHIIAGIVEGITKKAVFIKYRNRKVWLPLRYIGVDIDDFLISKPPRIEIPEWLYRKEFLK